MLGVLCLSLLIVFVGNSSLNVAIPTLSRELRRHRVAAAVGRRRRTRSCSPGLLFSTGALGDRFGRKGALQFGLVVFLVGACAARRCRPRCGSSSRAARVMGAGGRVHHAVDAVDPRQRLPARRAHQGHRDLGRVTGAAGAVGPVASGLLLGHFWFGSVFLVNVPIIVLALVAGWFLVPEVEGPRAGPARSGRRACSRSSASSRSSTA